MNRGACRLRPERFSVATSVIRLADTAEGFACGPQSRATRKYFSVRSSTFLVPCSNATIHATTQASVRVDT